MRLRLVRLPVHPVVVVAVVIAAGCSGANPPAASTPAPAPSSTSSIASTTTRPPPVTTTTPPTGRDARWRADLERIIPGMTAIHPNLFHGTSRAELEVAVARLSARVPQATDDELMVGVLEVVALVSAAGCEGHTGAFVWGTGTYSVDSLPLRLWLFDHDLVVVDALAPYRSLIGSRIDAIAGHPTADVLAAIEPLVAHDNAQTIRLVSPRLVLIPQVLRGLGLAAGGPVALEVSPATVAAGAAAGRRRPAAVDPIPMADYNRWAGPYGLHLPVDPKVRYLSRIGDALWWELLPDGRTLYVQYNRVDRLPAQQLSELRAALGASSSRRVILDIRHNYGGELSALNPIVAMFKDPSLPRPDGLFVLMGRNTFSAGSLLVARLQRDTAPVLVGEAMGGCPTTWGNSEEVTLTSSGIVIDVAGELSVGVDRADPRLTIEPVLPAVLTAEAWLAGRDPALDAIATARS